MFSALESLSSGTGSLVTARGLFPVLADMIAWHVRGTRFGIHMDPADGLCTPAKRVCSSPGWTRKLTTGW